MAVPKQKDGNISFKKIPKIPKGSDAFESVRDEIEHEKVLFNTHVNHHSLHGLDSPPRSRAGSQSRASPAQMWFIARARLEKPSLYKIVGLATSKWKS